MIKDKIDAFLADKGYDADAIREKIASANVETVIPAKRTGAIRSHTTKPSINGETGSSVSSTSSRTGGASRPDMTRPRNPISDSLPSRQSNYGYPLVHER
ncbi:hypothetical protein [Mesorhizobium sp. SP-1A]|uniref:hypothetical protein n=1 Tax=Mesorhizobium sp. SP-1A TaxID=3077840 RepID=UPI0039656143